MKPTAVARAYYDALDGHDYDRLAELLARDFRHERPDRTIDGRSSFVRFMREERPQTDTSHPIDGLYERGDGVAVEGRLLTGDGDLIVQFVDVFAVEDGQIDTVRTYTR